MRIWGWIILGTAVCSAAAAVVAMRQSARVGERNPGGTLINTGQRIDPQGKVTVFGARPVDALISRDGRTIYVKENQGLTILDASTGAIRQRLAIPGGSSLTGLALDSRGKRLYYSNAGADVVEIDVEASPARVARSFKMPPAKVGGAAYPCGLAISDQSLYAALSRSNQVVELELSTGKIVRTLEVAVAPFALAVGAEDDLWVTCWGQAPRSGEQSAKSSGTEVAVDARGVGKGGVLQRISLKSGEVLATAGVGSQPCEIAVGRDRVWVASANSDAVFAVDRDGSDARVAWKGSVGSAPSSLAILPGGEVAVACGGSNEVAMLDAKGRAKEAYRSGWYPTAVRANGDALIIASAKGIGSRGVEMRAGKLDPKYTAEKSETPLSAEATARKGVYQFTGVVSIISRKETRAAAVTRLPDVPKPRADATPVPVPERPGEPSLIKHVIYLLKENRTYDQVFGDMKKGDGDPNLCIYGEQITPNHHALADEFVLLDNYYCNGVLSADGHSWSTEGNATTYFERSFGGWTRSYPFGDDPLAISSTGHIWDAVLDKGLSFRNYGEYNYAEPANGEKYLDILKDFELGARKVKFKQNIGVERLRRHSDPECPGWNMEIPDVVRAGYFIRDLKAGKLSAFTSLYLPQDHTSGGGSGSPHPATHVADNDLALGRIVDAVSHSPFWKETAIFVIEDDPQDGFDHVDGHRSLCLVASPYTRRGAVVSDFYNQAAVLKTIRHILGIAPATRFERIANLMGDCFQSKPDLTPYTVRANRVPLDRMNGDKTSFANLDLSKPDLVNEDLFNRQLWTLSRGKAQYPAEWSGAHGRGLASRGLRLEGSMVDDDDD